MNKDPKHTVINMNCVAVIPPPCPCRAAAPRDRNAGWLCVRFGFKGIVTRTFVVEYYVVITISRSLVRLEPAYLFAIQEELLPGQLLLENADSRVE